MGDLRLSWALSIALLAGLADSYVPASLSPSFVRPHRLLPLKSAASLPQPVLRATKAKALQIKSHLSSDKPPGRPDSPQHLSFAQGLVHSAQKWFTQSAASALCVLLAFTTLTALPEISTAQLPGLELPVPEAKSGSKLDPAVEDKVQVFAEILNDINIGYVDPVDLDKITELGFNAMLQSLDPYTEFENPRATNMIRTVTTGNYAGVGLAIQKLKDPQDKELPYVYVMNAFEGYAFDSGIRVGDKILTVDGKDIRDASVTEASELLRGKRGTEVKVTFERVGVDKPMEKTLVRRQVPIRDVPVALFLDDKQEVGYLKLSGFSQTAPIEMAFVIKRMEEQSPAFNSLILDLRGNTGGLLTSAIKIADFFLPDGVNVVSTKGRLVESEDGDIKAPKKEIAYTAQQIRKYIGQADDGTPLFSNEALVDKDIRLVVLVDKLTASASEIVAGAVQDHDRGVIIGETTFGKGLVQQLQRLSGGRQIKFTSGKYYTPSGRCIQAKTYAQNKDGAGTKEAAIADKDRKVFYTDNGRPVRDGGGIEPDVVYPAPKAGQLELSLQRWEAFFKYAGEIYKTLPDGEALAEMNQPMVTDEMYQNFQDWVLAQRTNDDIASYGPFAKSLDIFTDALKESGYTDVIQDIKVVQKHLNDLILDEFKTNKEQIKQKLEIALRQRYIPESKVLAKAVDSDKQIAEAVKYAKDAKLYNDLLKKPL